MKKNRFINLSVIVIALFTGCANESTSDNTGNSNEGIESSIGTYDLRDYLAPSIDTNATFTTYQAVGSIDNIERVWVYLIHYKLFLVI